MRPVGLSMKLVAQIRRVKKVVKQHGLTKDGIENLPIADRIEIELEGDKDEPCMMFRYTNSGDFCGDTWHEDLKSAFAQAEFEYGIVTNDYLEISD